MAEAFRAVLCGNSSRAMGSIAPEHPAPSVSPPLTGLTRRRPQQWILDVEHLHALLQRIAAYKERHVLARGSRYPAPSTTG